MIGSVSNRISLNLDLLESVKVDVDALKALCIYDNPEYKTAVSRAQRRYAVKGIPRTISTYTVENDVISFPRGLLRSPAFHELLQPACDWDFEDPRGWTRVFRDKRCSGDAEAAKVIRRLRDAMQSNTEWRLRDFQAELVDAATRDETALWIAPAAAGKTEASLAFGISTGLPVLILSPSTKVLEEWQRRCALRFGFEPGVFQGPRREIRPITIGMLQTVANHIEEVESYFGVVIEDEAQTAGAETFSTTLDRLPAKYRLGVTADERRADGKEEIVYDVFGPVSHRVPRELMLERGYILDAEIRIVPTAFKAEWYTKLRPSDRQWQATRLAGEMVEDEARNELIKTVLGWCKGRQTMVLSQRVEHCRVLDAQATELGWKSGLFLGGQKHKKEFESCFRRMHDGELEVAFGTYQAVGVGFNIPQLECGIFAMPRANSAKAEMQFKQFLGRFERTSFDTQKTGAVTYYLWDQHVHSDNVIRKLMKWRPNVSVMHEGEFIPAAKYLELRKRADEQHSRVHGFEQHEPPPPRGRSKGRKTRIPFSRFRK